MADARQYSLRFTIATLVVFLLLATVAGVLVIAFLVRGKTIDATAEALQGEVSARITERFVERFGSVPNLLHGLAEGVGGGRLQTTDEALLETLADRMRFEDRVEWLAWIRPDGTGCGIVTDKQGLLALRMGADLQAEAEIWQGDGTRKPAPARDMSGLLQVPWVKDATVADGHIWSKRYIRPLDGQPGRACALAVRSQGELSGVLGAGLSARFVRPYLESIRVGESGGVFTLDQITGELRTWPNEEARTRMGAAIASAVDVLPGGVAALKPGPLHSIAVSEGGVDYHVGISLQAPDGILSWAHAIVIPDDELIGYFGGFLAPGLIAIALLLIGAILLAQTLSRRIARSLQGIATDLRSVGDFELTERPAAQSLIREINVVADATERMKASLRSFGRYVPTDLVRDLLSQGQEARLDGEERPLSLFFSDVAGFTASSEGMSPTALVDALGAYLDVLTKAVEREHGTIDKFIGDGVLAFFNAPREDVEHVRHACRAALGVQAALAEAAPAWQAAGLPDFTTRIGLHTAEVVVGNIGTPERFAYTVIGDGVNLAARLESLNKAYGTSILTSEEVRAAAGDGFLWRPIDRTSVVGRSAAGTVYELVGYADQVADDVRARVTAYTEAFEHYLGRRFTEAAAAFDALAPKDPPSAILGARAAAYAVTPPPEDWAGVHVQTKK